MELMNKGASRLDLATSPMFSFKQDPMLVIAINKLYNANDVVGSPLILPERKLLFTEIQQLLEQSCNVNVAGKSDSLSKNAKQTKSSTIKKIEDILSNINNSAEVDGSPKLIIRNQRLWNNCIYDLDRVALKALNDAKTTTLCYSNGEDKSRFNTIIFVLTKVHDLLLKNLTVTRRELFYQNVSRFGNQSRVDIGVRDVCCLLNTPPWELGIVATAKGLIGGPLKIYQSDGTMVNCMVSGGTLIPQDVKGIREFKSTAKYILVVEKDAIFQKLLDEGALVRLGPVIILTGKGYPDVCTRQLLCRLVNELRLKALALVDADPHGYEIFFTYKYGSLAQSHLSDALACSSLSLLGARHRDIMTLASTEARLPLTQLDRRKLASLIKRPYLNTPAGARIKTDLEGMLASGVKAEIEAVAATPAALCDSYIPSKLIQGDYLG